jgi:NitT/TauT family transport system substrate-binding protein
MFTRRSMLILVTAILAGCQPAGLPTSDTPTPAREVRLLLGFRPDVQFAPFYLAEQKGYFAAAGLKVTIEHSDDVLRLVADGQAELGVADATDVMIGRTAGIPIRYVSPLYGRFPVALIGQTRITRPEELAGLRIGTPGRFGSSWHALLALLDAGGLGPDDVEIRDYPQFNQVEGLLNGDVDLITGFRNNEPIQLRARGMEVSLLTVDEFAPLPGPGLVAGDELLASDRELAVAVAEAVRHAQEDIAADPEAGLEAAIAEVPVIGEDRETALAVLEATVELWLDDSGDVASGIDRGVWESGYDILRELGLIDGSVPLDEIYDDLSLDGEPGG